MCIGVSSREYRRLQPRNHGPVVHTCTDICSIPTSCCYGCRLLTLTLRLLSFLPSCYPAGLTIKAIGRLVATWNINVLPGITIYAGSRRVAACDRIVLARAAEYAL